MDRDAEFWTTLGAAIQDMGLAQPIERDPSLDGECIEFHRESRACMIWVSSQAIRRIAPQYLATITKQADYALSKANS